MVQQAGIQHTKGAGGGQKRGKKGKGPELVFDEQARAEYLTGFHKRKQERKEAGREHLAKKAKEELLVQRKEARKARRDQAAENVRNERKAFGLEGEGESDLDGNDDETPQEEEYDSDQHHTHVTVEAFDPEEAAFAQATAAPPKAKTDAEPRKAEAAKPNGASPTKVEALPPSSRRVNKAKANASLTSPPTRTRTPTNLRSSTPTGKGKEADHPHQEEDGPSQQLLQERRLVVSGFTSAFTQAELSQRFSAFGTVLALDGFGKQDGVGQLRPFAYLTLRATEPQIRRCMNLLSGSMWKGAKLRIGEAKPDFDQRWAQEQQQEAEKRTQQERERRAKLKRKRLPPGMALESPYVAEPITKQHLEQGFAWGWKQSPEGYLVRPLRIRPDHPLPKPQPLPAALGLEAQKQKPKRLNSKPPTKAHRITIDPTRYGAVHLSQFTDSPSDAVDVEALGPGEWQCYEIDPNDTEERPHAVGHRLVRWQYVGADDIVLHEEFAKLPVRVLAAAPAVEDDALFDDFDRYSAAPSDDLFSDFPTKAHPQHGARSEVEDLFSDFPNASAPRSAETSDLFSDFPSAVAPRAPPAPVATQGTFVPGLDPEEYNDPGYFSDGYDEALPGRSVPVIDDASERQTTLAVIAQMFENVAPEQPQPADDDSVAQDSEDDSSEPAAEAPADAPQETAPSEDSTESSSSEDESDTVAEESAEEESSSSSEDEDEEMLPDAAEEQAPETVLSQRQPSPEPAPVEESAKSSRRAAFLFDAAAAARVQDSSAGVDARLIPRFDPGPRTDAAPADTPPASVRAPQPASGNTVAFSSLKAMFQPQQASSADATGFSFALGDETEPPRKGFSIMDALGLELELDLDHSVDEPVPEAPAVSFEGLHPSRAAMLNPSAPTPTAPNSFFFLTPPTHALPARRTDAQITDAWHRHQASLTSQIKKRHREALKKRKRRVGPDITRAR